MRSKDKSQRDESDKTKAVKQDASGHQQRAGQKSGPGEFPTGAQIQLAVSEKAQKPHWQEVNRCQKPPGQDKSDESCGDDKKEDDGTPGFPKRIEFWPVE